MRKPSWLENRGRRADPRTSLPILLDEEPTSRSGRKAERGVGGTERLCDCLSRGPFRVLAGGSGRGQFVVGEGLVGRRRVIRGHFFADSARRGTDLEKWSQGRKRCRRDRSAQVMLSWTTMRLPFPRSLSRPCRRLRTRSIRRRRGPRAGPKRTGFAGEAGSVSGRGRQTRRRPTRPSPTTNISSTHAATAAAALKLFMTILTKHDRWSLTLLDVELDDYATRRSRNPKRSDET
jgi:hypothetical protein